MKIYKLDEVTILFGIFDNNPGNNRSFSLSHNKKNKLKTIQWKKLRNWDVIEDKKIRHFPKF